MRAARQFACAALLAIGAQVQAQGADPEPSPILTIDQDRLFAETRTALRSTAEIEAEAIALAEENRRIEESLSAEERQLTEDRAGLTPEEFTALADAFDEKVRQIRAEQDAKARALAIRQEEVRQAFFVEIGGILSDIVRERGADVVLDRRSVFLSADRVDITDEVIERINARVAETVEPDPPVIDNGEANDTPDASDQ